MKRARHRVDEGFLTTRRTALLGGIVLGAVLASSPAMPDDCDGNGLDDIEEIEAGQAADCDGNLVLDECDIRPVNPGLVRWTSFEFRDAIDTSLAIGDIDADGDADLVVGARYGQLIGWSRGEDLDFSFFEEEKPASPRHLADIDGDGDLDLLATRSIDLGTGEALSIRFNSGQGDFGEARFFPLEDDENYITVADMTGDGLPEILLGGSPASSPPAPEIRIRHNLGEGAFGPSVKHAANVLVNRIHPADLDGDGDADLVVTDTAVYRSRVYFNDGSGQLRAGQVWSGCAGILSTADLDGDGDLDITAGICLLKNDGAGIFELPTVSGFGEAVPGDFDGDGDTDLAAGGALLLVNVGQGRFSRAPEGSGAVTAPRLSTGDFTGDGLPDLLIRGTFRSSIYTIARIAHDSDCNRNGILDSCDLTSGAARDCNSNRLPDECDLVPDCNSNGIPDDCDAAIAGRDCDLNGVPDSCEPFLDCNSNGTRDACDIDSQSSMDCNANRIPDECERPPGDPCRLANPVRSCAEDCNGNLIHDACDRASGSTLDGCANPLTIQLGFRGPIGLRDSRGGSVRFEAVATLAATVRVPAPAGSGVLGWSISVVPEGCAIVSATTEGTAGAPESEGGYWVQGFNRTWVDSSLTHAYSAVALTIQGVARAVLPLDGGPYDILRVSLESDRPADGTCAPCRLFYRNPLSHHYDMAVTVDFKSAPFEIEDATLCPGFRRGDVNGSGEVDISDPIRLLMSLFLGAEPPPCMDGADGNDDGLVNISDGIFLLQDLFVGAIGTVIPRPGPFECGLDPTEDALDCADPGSCS